MRDKIIKMLHRDYWAYLNNDQMKRIADEIMGLIGDDEGSVTWCGVCQEKMVERTFAQIAKRLYAEYQADFLTWDEPYEHLMFDEWLDRKEE